MKISQILPLVVGSAAAGILASISPAQALVFNIGGTNYDVTTVTGSSLSLSPLLTSQVWWGNSSLASSFAGTVGSALGSPNISGAGGPFFFYDVSVLPFSAWFDTTTSSVQNGIQGAGSTYAIATQSTPVPFDIPGGATIPTVGSLLALGAMRKVKKRLAAKTLVVNPVETVV
ncbi:hypothetical protein [Anabaena sp. UHCC 0451]|uniref:hypothetical protein n=1 Tax=Anabaena sp. UHCC 0451 TaxID=2055235 RepID=UPI002B1E9E21|nr:hypothetical protein [Anabaena sp. UHCC 0451]MEA5578944.1 hypothetical protein [Anabaena sp. UHCC 0451]